MVCNWHGVRNELERSYEKTKTISGTFYRPFQFQL